MYCCIYIRTNHMEGPEDNFFGWRDLGFSEARLVYLSRESSNNTTNIDVSGKYTLQEDPKALKHFFCESRKRRKTNRVGTLPFSF